MFSLFTKCSHFPLEQNQTKKRRRKATFNLFLTRSIAMRYNSNYFATVFAKLSLRSTVRLNTRWPGLESSLSRQK